MSYYYYNRSKKYTEKRFEETFDLSESNTQTFTNLEDNGNFNSMWAVVNVTHSVSNNTGFFTATAASGRLQESINTVSGHKYYLKAEMKTDSNQVGLRFAGTPLIFPQGTGEFEVVSGIIDGIFTGETTLRFQDLRESGWTQVQVRSVMVIDLTDIYGAGNEPSKNDFDSIISNVNDGEWFAGTVEQRTPFAQNEVVVYDGISLKSESKSSNKPLYGRNGVCFGDSVTEFGNYPEVIGDKTGADITNVGFGGARMSNHPSFGYGPFCMTKLADAITTGDFSQQIAEKDAGNGDDNTETLDRLMAIDWNQVDFITINYGTNDFASDIPLGTETDNGDTTYFGAINYVVQTIQSAFPHIEIIFVTPAWRWYDDNGIDADSTPNPGGNHLYEFVDTMISAAQKNKLPVLDLYRTSGINKYTASLYIPPTEEVHLNQKGYEHLGNRIGAFLNATL
ncbi:SGNH/GDSL hydrolase family protein [Halobacillus litoralis]|uniref:SGNH/GDSL hydrolase family protein n=1 Tax=Halobacillus litoralis TaxID=45668 RepID=UPI001CD22863|nr:SGNH/GDSL hydrolase family protein [Halobacillus litoralis]MCA1021649.1 SGNH/GDSL hydrolase family protein [Halobacillus litoralis]